MALRVLDRVCNFFAILAGIYLVAIMFGIVFQATVRSLGFSGSSHVFTFSEYGLLYIAMFASPWVVRIKGHVYIEIFTAMASEDFRPTLSRMIAVLSLVICLILAWYTLEATYRAYIFDDRDMKSLDMPRWLLLGSMPICFVLMAAQFLRFVVGREVMHSGQAGVHE